MNGQPEPLAKGQRRAWIDGERPGAEFTIRTIHGDSSLASVFIDYDDGSDDFFSALWLNQRSRAVRS